MCLAFRAVIKQIDPAPDNVQMRADSFTLSSSELPPLSPAGRGVQFGAGKALEPLLHTFLCCWVGWWWILSAHLPALRGLRIIAACHGASQSRRVHSLG